MINEIKITEKAINQVNQLVSTKEPGTYFRISVLGGGCSGFKYDFSFDKKIDHEDKKINNIMTDNKDKKDKIKPFTLFNNETGQSFEIPVLKSTEGPDVLDIRSLYKDTGMFTFDPGFVTTASCKSKITYLDGEKGILLHRGYPIDQLANQSSYLEVCYLLLYGELPTKTQFDEFRNNLNERNMVHEHLER